MNSAYILIFLSKLLIISSTQTDNLKSLWRTNEWGSPPENPSDYISILFQKLSDSPEGISTSSLENFVNCTSGISSCSSHDNEAYKLLTNCSANNGLSPQECHVLNSCSTGKDLVSILPFFNDTQKFITKEEFSMLLPLVVHQMQTHVCEEIDLNSDSQKNHKKPTTFEVWGYGILFVTLISGCSLAGVSVLPLMARDFYQKLLTVLIGLAVGSLAASAVFHLIPQAYGLIQEGDHSYLYFSLSILGGIWMFFMIERILKIVFIAQKIRSGKFTNSMSAQAIVPKADHTNKEIGNCECGSSFGGSVGCDVDSKYNLNNGSMEGVHENSVDGEQGSCLPNSKNVKLIFKSQEQAIKASFGHEQKPEKSYHVQEVEFQQGKDSVIATVAWMIICGDGFHNFIDGVSIGAAFQESILTGISISLAVLCEELPHELGDFAVLINSGMTMKQALFYNFLSATTCYIGMGVGIAIGEFTQDSTYIFALAAGMFLYISLVDMLPEMNETATKAAECSVRDSIQVLILQNLGMFLGVFILFVLAYFQDRISLGLL
ncbi:UNVERIFIED_CONTAM: hypothetical protein RMT77_008067 [Armadillidium vulgare]